MNSEEMSVLARWLAVSFVVLFHPIKNYSEGKGTILATIHYDYTFSNSLNLQFEALYNGFGADDISGGIKNIIYMDLCEIIIGWIVGMLRHISGPIGTCLENMRGL